jgi:hypothetical protein
MGQQQGFAMDRFAAVGAALALLTLTDAADAFETRTPQARTAQSAGAAAVTDVSAQNRRPRRANLRIIVRPPSVAPPNPSRLDPFPSPYPYAWPGPGYVRDCVGWLEPEWRPSGTVIVPRRRCAWVRG